MSSNENIIQHSFEVKKRERGHLKKQKPCILWFTGLSGSGKSTIANALDIRLHSLNKHTYILDGDNVRLGLNKGLTFSDEDRVENIRRIGEVAKLFVDAGEIVLSAFISPFKEDRQRVRMLVEDGEFIEVFVDTPLEICEKRDPKGLYKKVRSGEIKNFTGISSPYEKPDSPEILIETQILDVDKSVEKIISYLDKKGYLSC